MSFIQAMHYTTSRPDEVKEVLAGWERATDGKREARRIVSTRHHDDPNRHVDLVFFDSYDSAMANSQLPETDEFARRLRELVDGELVFLDLDVEEVRGPGRG